MGARAARAARDSGPTVEEWEIIVLKIATAAHLEYDAVAVFYFAIRTAFTATCALHSHSDDAWSDHFLSLLDKDKRFNLLMVGLQKCPDDIEAFLAHYDMCMRTMVGIQAAR